MNEFNFDLPSSVVTRLKFEFEFEGKQLTDWKHKFRSWIVTLPADIRTKTISKGIEYAQFLISDHKPNCKEPAGECQFEFELLSKISLLKEALKPYLAEMNQTTGGLKFTIVDESGNPKNVSASKYMQTIAKDFGVKVYLNESLDSLKQRKEIFEKQLSHDIAERKLKELETTESDINSLYQIWLKSELDVIERWLSENNTNSDKIEFAKYKDYVLEELCNQITAETDQIIEENKSRMFWLPSDIQFAEKNYPDTNEQILYFKKRKAEYHAKLSTTPRKNIGENYLAGIEARIEYLESLQGQQMPTPRVSLVHKKENSEPQLFTDIFIKPDWKKYITALQKTNPPLLNADMEFIGKPQKHKGVICSWIKHLQNKGEVKEQANRSQLAKVLNSELKNFNLGKDGKTFDNISSTYTNEFESQLVNLSK